MIRRIRDLLYEQGFTISGARNKMQEILQSERERKNTGELQLDGLEVIEMGDAELNDFKDSQLDRSSKSISDHLQFVRRELFEIRDLLSFSL